jgi:hypothetical protein
MKPMTSNQFLVYKFIYFKHLEDVLDIKNLSVVLIGVFFLGGGHGLSRINVIIILNKKDTQSTLALMCLGLVSVRWLWIVRTCMTFVFITLMAQILRMLIMVW